MSTECHKRANYLFEQFAGVLLFRRSGRTKFYAAKCSHCGRSYELKERDAVKAIKQNNHAQRHGRSGGG